MWSQRISIIACFCVLLLLGGVARTIDAAVLHRPSVGPGAASRLWKAMPSSLKRFSSSSMFGRPSSEAMLNDLLTDRQLLRDLLEASAGRPLSRDATSDESIAWLHDAATNAVAYLREEFQLPLDHSSAAEEYLYWRFVPALHGTLPTNGTTAPPVSFSSHCHADVKATLQSVALPIVTVLVTASTPTTSACNTRLFLTLASLGQVTELGPKTPSATVTFNVSGLDAPTQYMAKVLGVHVFSMNTTSSLQTLEALLVTVQLFTGTPGNATATAENNRQFLNSYGRFKPPVEWRPVADRKLLDVPTEAEVHDGDVFFLDLMVGVGTLIMWGTGGTAGHTTIALRDDQGALQLCESDSSGVFCTPFEKRLREYSSQAVVWAPLAPKYRATWNKTAAWERINATLGYAYGYQNVAFGWLDSANGNLPCMPPDFKRCLTFEAIQYFILLVDEVAPAVATTLAGQALNMRAGTAGMSIAATLQYAYRNAGLMPGEVVAIPEQNDWLYNTTRYGKPAQGPAQVCSTFACNTLRVASSALREDTGGDNGLQCGELTPWDLEAAMMWDDSQLGANRPAACQAVAPTNMFCQLSGATTLHLGLTPNARPVHPGMGQYCLSQGPWYDRGGRC